MIENIGAFDRIEMKMNLAADALQGFVITLCVAAQQTIMVNLKQALGDSKAKHFDVSVKPSGVGVEVSVRVLDDVGKFIYLGTTAHKITAAGGGAMPIDGGRFASTVHHPGTKSHEEKINEAVKDGIMQAYRILGGAGRVL